MRQILLGALLLMPLIVWAVIVTITSSGNWSNSGIWSGADIGDVITDDVTFNNSLTITIQNSESFTVGDVNMGSDNTLTINSGGSLTLGASGNAKDFTTGNDIT
ncbi:MAG: hypothetical protein O6939_09245, partial [Bacteroidetes bacterium]|nr:hypothetical protein [Bacteroidota bacterium]